MAGSYETAAVYRVPFAERWSGAEWVVQTVPSPAETKYSSVQGVSCVTGSACTIVGTSYASSLKFVTLAEQWNGAEWKIQPTPNNEKGEGWLSGGVSCSSSTMCAAVGNTGKTFSELYR